MNRACKRPAQRQRGIGLVEMMLALTIGLFIVLGVVQEFISLRSTDMAVKQLSAMQSQQRIAMHFLRSAIRSAGSYPDVLSTPVETQFPAIASLAAGQTWGGTDADGNATLFVRYVATVNDDTRGCSASLTVGHVYLDSFHVVNDTSSPLHGTLVCDETDLTANTQTSASLVANLASMRVLFGLDTAGDGSVTQYRRAGDVDASLWPCVKTAQVTLEFNNTLTGPGQAATVILSENILFMANN